MTLLFHWWLKTFAYSFALNLELVPSEGSSVNDALEIDTVFAITGSTVKAFSSILMKYICLVCIWNENSTGQWYQNSTFLIGCGGQLPT